MPALREFMQNRQAEKKQPFYSKETQNAVWFLCLCNSFRFFQLSCIIVRFGSDPVCTLKQKTQQTALYTECNVCFSSRIQQHLKKKKKANVIQSHRWFWAEGGQGLP